MHKVGFYTWKNNNDLKHFINRVMKDQLLSADGHLSFCTMQCNELVLTLQDGDSTFL